MIFNLIYSCSLLKKRAQQSHNTTCKPDNCQYIPKNVFTSNTELGNLTFFLCYVYYYKVQCINHIMILYLWWQGDFKSVRIQGYIGLTWGHFSDGAVKCCFIVQWAVLPPLPRTPPPLFQILVRCIDVLVPCWCARVWFCDTSCTCLVHVLVRESVGTC